jgi:hypothetical protein
MASADAVLDAGETLVALVTAAVSGMVVPSNVVLSTADEMRTYSPPDPAVTIFLYNVAVNAETRNAPPPPGFSRPPLTLELRYLVTPWAKSAATSHLICGHVLQHLADRATLVHGDLTGASWGVDDTLQILLESLPVSEHHDIWEPADIPYKLSLAYLVRVVGLDPVLPSSSGVVTSATFGGTA